VELTEHQSNTLYLTLKRLFAEKSARNPTQRQFTSYQLAKALNINHSIIIKLMHPDPTKRVTRPKIDTLSKIVEFFRKDGFNISIDSLLFGYEKTTSVATQVFPSVKQEQSIPLYALHAFPLDPLGFIEIKLSQSAEHLIALQTEVDLKPIFKRGSVFIIDTRKAPESDNLVAVRFESNPEILIRKFYLEDGKTILRCYEDLSMSLELSPLSNYEILGVVIHINART